MKKLIQNIISDYLKLYPKEIERLSNFIYYLDSHLDQEIIDWNNFEGHIVASGFIYAKENKKFLVLYHNDLDMYVYPGRHIDITDKDPVIATRRELEEETGLKDLELYNITDNLLVPIDIDTHIIKKNERLNLPPHYHFDFRYLFIIDNIKDIQIDKNESSNYKWVDIEEISKILSLRI